MPRKRKKRLLIHVVIPNEQGFSMKVTGIEGEMSEETLARWVPVCERITMMAANHFAGITTETESRGTPEETNDAE